MADDLRGKVTVTDLRQIVQADADARQFLVRGLKMPADGIAGPGYTLDFVAKHGREHRAAPWVGERMTPKECFRNAGLLVQEHPRHVIYVEGYALSSEQLAIGFTMPTHHAWTVDAAGVISDPTFRHPETSIYLGLPIPSMLYLRNVARTRYYGVFYPGEMLNVQFFREYIELLTAGDLVLP